MYPDIKNHRELFRFLVKAFGLDECEVRSMTVTVGHNQLAACTVDLQGKNETIGEAIQEAK